MAELQYLVISDIHLGHRQNPTANIITNLDEYFEQYRTQTRMSKLDIVFIAGDLFDSLMSLDSQDYHLIKVWMHRLMSWCGRLNIKLRVLEGTPTHDWHQSRMMLTLHGITGHATAVDFKYIETLHIEYMTDLDLSILYVPDEWHPSADETLRQARALVADTGRTQVDIAIMHGAFTFQLPQAPPHIQRHDEASYLALVRHWINIGHVHTHGIYDRIMGQGSFDRLSHGEESPKGGCVMSIRGPGGDRWEFITNPTARIFKTIEIRMGDLDRALAKIYRVCDRLPHDSHVRIKAKVSHPCYTALKDIQAKYPMLYFTRTKLDEDGESAKPSHMLPMASYTPITISSDTIVELITTDISGHHALTDTQLSMLTRILEDSK